MNREAFGHLFSTIGDAPECVARMRQIVVALAVSGKLGTLPPSSSPADILAKVEEVKATLVAQRVIPKPKKLSPISEADLPASFQDSSCFAPLGMVARIEKGLTGIKDAPSGPFPLVVTAADRASSDHFDFDGDAAIIPLVSSTGHGHASINRLHYQDGKFALGTILAAVLPYDPEQVSARFLFEYLSAFKDELLVSRMTGSANVTLSIGRIAEVPVPLVCPSVQKTVDELMALCDRLEEARKEREAARDRLTVASLARLNAPDTDPATFTTHARFALDNFSVLTNCAGQIKQLRQTILNLAVRGKLVEQDAGDEPAATLIRRISKLKDERVAAGTLRQQKEVPTVEDAVQEFVAPASWQWARLVDVVKLWNGFAFKSGDFMSEGVPVIRIGDLQRGEVSLNGAVHVSNAVAHGVGAEIWIPEEALLIAMSGATTGKTAFNRTGKRLLLNQRVGRIEPFEVNIRFIQIFLETIVARNLEIAFGTAIPNLSAQQINLTAIAVPPLAEQHRIVAKVDELMALCDRLEARLATVDETRQRLLEAVLHEALEPAEVRELEPA